MKLINKIFPFLFRNINTNFVNKGHELQKSKELFLSLFYNTTVGLYQTTPEGKILSANPSIIKMLEFDSLEDLLKRDLSKGSYVDKNKRILFKNILHEKGEIIDFESEWLTKNSNIIYVLEGARAVKNKKGKIIRYDGSVLNITAKRKAEIALQDALEKAKESDKLKSAFLANMSHEIRTPMNGILGFADLLNNPDLSQEAQEKYTQIIKKSGERMLNIINDIVCISKIESGTVEVNNKEFNINELQEYLYAFFEPQVKAKKMDLIYNSSLPPEYANVSTDHNKFISIYSNLIKNAVKYTDKGFIEFGCNVKKNFLEFFVKDTGSGIESERQEAIFERFIQADIENKLAKQGVGLGLSISKAYVEMLGGKIWLKSEKGRGSTFYFSIPYNSRNTSKDKSFITDPIIETQIKNLNILLAEDDEVSSLLLNVIFEKTNCTLLQAKNGIEAVELCQKHPEIDLILMDIKMPEMNGYEATRKIREFNKEVIIIAQTAHALSDEINISLKAGFNEHLSKPINKNDLFSIIKHYFRT